jgi:MoaA/NifB/PqqE/SkfB family radical SAM enzyme
MIAELARIAPVRNEAAFRANQFINVFVSITNRCNLKCEHCFEGPNLNTGDHITNAELKQRISYLRMLGTSQIQFSGGEPMLRLGLVLDMIETGDEIDYWIYTSGYNLTLENAERLKRKGLTGILVSIDHFEEAEHNRFRGKDHAFEWATHGVRNSIQSGLVTALSVCVTRSLATEEKLRRYADMARQLNVSFVQLLEPKSVGNYRGKDVELSIAEKETLERFYLRMNNSPEFATYPIFTYPGYHQRRVGCFGGGNRSIYLDTYGNLQACPFCQLGKSCGGATLPEQLLQVQTRACVSTAHSDVNI